MHPGLLIACSLLFAVACSTTAPKETLPRYVLVLLARLEVSPETVESITISFLCHLDRAQKVLDFGQQDNLVLKALLEMQICLAGEDNVEIEEDDEDEVAAGNENKVLTILSSKVRFRAMETAYGDAVPGTGYADLQLPDTVLKGLTDDQMWCMHDFEREIRGLRCFLDVSFKRLLNPSISTLPRLSIAILGLGIYAESFFDNAVGIRAIRQALSWCFQNTLSAFRKQQMIVLSAVMQNKTTQHESYTLQAPPFGTFSGSDKPSKSLMIDPNSTPTELLIVLTFAKQELQHDDGLFMALLRLALLMRDDEDSMSNPANAFQTALESSRLAGPANAHDLEMLTKWGVLCARLLGLVKFWSDGTHGLYSSLYANYHTYLLLYGYNAHILERWAASYEGLMKDIDNDIGKIGHGVAMNSWTTMYRAFVRQKPLSSLLSEAKQYIPKSQVAVDINPPLSRLILCNRNLLGIPNFLHLIISRRLDGESWQSIPHAMLQSDFGTIELYLQSLQLTIMASTTILG